jgi:hypothetical protein
MMQKPSIRVKSGGLRGDPDWVQLDHSVLALRAGARTMSIATTPSGSVHGNGRAGMQGRVLIGRYISFGNIMLIAHQRAVTYPTPLQSMNIGGCAPLETRDGRLVPVRTNLIGLVDRKQSTRD